MYHEIFLFFNLKQINILLQYFIGYCSLLSFVKSFSVLLLFVKLKQVKFLLFKKKRNIIFYLNNLIILKAHM